MAGNFRVGGGLWKWLVRRMPLKRFAKNTNTFQGSLRDASGWILSSPGALRIFIGNATIRTLAGGIKKSPSRRGISVRDINSLTVSSTVWWCSFVAADTEGYKGWHLNWSLSCSANIRPSGRSVSPHVSSCWPARSIYTLDSVEALTSSTALMSLHSWSFAKLEFCISSFANALSNLKDCDTKQNKGVGRMIRKGSTLYNEKGEECGEVNGHPDLLLIERSAVAQGQPFNADILWESGTTSDRARLRAEISPKSTPVWLYHRKICWSCV